MLCEDSVAERLDVDLMLSVDEELLEELLERELTSVTVDTLCVELPVLPVLLELLETEDGLRGD